MKKNEEETPTKGNNNAMKIQVLHDDKGNIISFSMVENGVKDGLNLVPKKNQSIKVVNMPSVKGETLSNEEDFKRFVEKMKKYKVDTSRKEGKLISK